MVLTNSWTWKDWATPFGQNIWKVSEYQLSIQRFVVFYLDCRPPNERCPSSLLCPISRPKLARDAAQLLRWNKSHKNHRKKISSSLKKSELENFNDRHRQRDFASREKNCKAIVFVEICFRGILNFVGISKNFLSEWKDFHGWVIWQSWFFPSPLSNFFLQWLVHSGDFSGCCNCAAAAAAASRSRPFQWFCRRRLEVRFRKKTIFGCLLLIFCSCRCFTNLSRTYIAVTVNMPWSMLIKN